MTKYFKIALLTFALFFSPGLVYAHGGVEKRAGNVTIYLTQNPISPLTGEKVQFTFVANKGDNIDRLANFPVTLSLIDTFYGDATKDKTILTENFTTDPNGAFQFEYVFNKENYFDIDLKFKDPVSGKNEDLGFLIQPRFSEKNSINLWQIIPSLIVGLILGLKLRPVISRFILKKTI